MGLQTILRGTTWNHSRGFTPMVATAQRFHELHPDVEIVWTKRSLQEFAGQPLTELARSFDLLVIDNPWAGFAARSGTLLDLKRSLPADFLAAQAASSVGLSHASYEFGGGHWALAIDAAAPVSACRPDLLREKGIGPPKTWDDVIALGRMGLVCCPSIPLDVYGNFLNLCASGGDLIFQNREEVASNSAGLCALERLKELVSVVPARFFELNPIDACEVMTQTDEFAYCPFTYGYSNYSRPDYARKLLKFGNLVTVDVGKKPSSMLGGTGLAVSTVCKHREVALEYARFVASPDTQRGVYFDAGGQPAHRAVWLDQKVNAACSNYFHDTLPMLDAAFIRPRYNGYLEFQDRAGGPIHTYLREGGDAGKVLDNVNKLYRESHKKE